eukprot:COSAG02_NODE_53860_length_299_cov_0.780000_1_plen_43_part_00
MELTLVAAGTTLLAAGASLERSEYDSFGGANAESEAGSACRF